MEAPITREALAAKRERWMQQRQAEMDRKIAESSLLPAMPAASTQHQQAQEASQLQALPPQPQPAEVLDKLAEQIASRLQVEVRRENARLMQNGAVGAQVESLLERHIATHQCPICFELMSGKEHAPTLLFPCGHTFCAACLRQHLEKLARKTCPYCRETVASQAPNISLQQVIDGFVERQGTLARGEVLPELVQGQENVAAAARAGADRSGAAPALGGACGGGAAGGTDAARYAEQYRAFSMRCRVMRNQLDESRAEAGALGEKQVTANAVLDHLEREEGAARERIEAARLELEVIQAQRAEQARKCDEIVARQDELRNIEGIVAQTVESLEADRQKALLLLRNFDAGLADALDAEFAD